MNPFKTLMILALTVGISFSSQAATYNVTTNTTWSASTYGGCNTCTFNISAGVTLNMDGGGGCTSCTFNGGTVNITGSVGLWTSSFFNNGNLTINYSGASFQAPTFTSENITINQTASFQGSGKFTGSKISITTGTTTCQACTFTNDTATMTNGSLLKAQNSTTTFTNSVFTLSNSASIAATSPLTFINSQFTLSGTGSLSASGGANSFNNTQLYLYGNTSFSTTSGPTTLQNNSAIIVGDGSAASTAYVFINSGANTFRIYDNSMLGVVGGNNSFQDNANWSYVNSSGTTHAYNTAHNTISCGAGYTNPCTTNYVYGCATLNSAGPVGCTVLAIAETDFSASPAGAGKVNLTWTDESTAALARFSVERSSDNRDWISIATLDAGLYATGSYHINDPSAPSGLVYYRLQMTDKDGKTTWSKVLQVNVLAADVDAGVSLFPNPATSHLFYLRMPTTAAAVVNIYSLSGQLLVSSRLKGQLQYPVELPQSLQAGSMVAVQVISGGKTQAFTLATR
jgi:hypothetical protein